MLEADIAFDAAREGLHLTQRMELGKFGLKGRMEDPCTQRQFKQKLMYLSIYRIYLFVVIMYLRLMYLFMYLSKSLC